MSRGPGRWQRAILERLETVPAFYQFELFPSERARRKKSSNPDTLWEPGYRDPRIVAARRATRTLANAGKVRLFYYRRDRPPYRRLVIARPSVDVEALRLCLPRMTARKAVASGPARWAEKRSLFVDQSSRSKSLSLKACSSASAHAFTTAFSSRFRISVRVGRFGTMPMRETPVRLAM